MHYLKASILLLTLAVFTTAQVHGSEPDTESAYTMLDGKPISVASSTSRFSTSIVIILEADRTKILCSGEGNYMGLDTITQAHAIAQAAINAKSKIMLKVRIDTKDTCRFITLYSDHLSVSFSEKR